MEIIKTFKKGNKVLRIFRVDYGCEFSPRDWDNLGTMVCFHNRYDLGDETDLKDDAFNGWEELKEYLIKELDALIIMPLYLFDHSGITISTTPFNCRWDSCQIGFIYTTKEDIKENFMIKKITKKSLKRSEEILKGEVEIYDHYLTGEVYGFELIKKVKFKVKKEYSKNKIKEYIEEEEEDLDSCSGYYGDDGIKNIIEETQFEGIDEVEE